MRAKWLWVVALAGVAAGCGKGHAIFYVDVYSFFKGTGQETIPYFVPPGTPDSASTFQRINLPGAGSSFVDSVIVNGKMDLANEAGSGTIGLQLFLAADSAGTLNPSALALTVPDAAVSGTAVTPDTIVGRFNDAVIQLFTGSQLWIRIQAKGTNSGVILLQGTAVIKSLWLTVAINDQIF